jgi:predicted transposase/invertase (TIGR01784 family)
MVLLNILIVIPYRFAEGTINEITICKNDFVFMKLFSEPGSEEILGTFQSAVLKEEITGLTIGLDRELLSNIISNKVGIIDAKAILKDGTMVNVEIQVTNEYIIGKKTFLLFKT